MFFFFKQKTAYEMRISDWSSDVCSSDLPEVLQLAGVQLDPRVELHPRQLEDFRVVKLHSFYVRYRLPLMIEVQCFEWAPGFDAQRTARSEERRVGKEGVRTCRSRGSP